MTDGALAQRAQVDFADVAAHQLDVRAVQVARIGAAAEQEAVQRGDLGASRRQRVAEVGAEEPGPAGHQKPCGLSSPPTPVLPQIANGGSCPKAGRPQGVRIEAAIYGLGSRGGDGRTVRGGVQTGEASSTP